MVLALSGLFAAAQAMDVGRDGAHLVFRQAARPGRHHAIARAVDGGGDRVAVTAIKPDRIVQRRSPLGAVARPIFGMARCTVFGKHRCPANRQSRIIVQGITGRMAQFHTKEMLDYGSNVVGGVVPVNVSKFVGPMPAVT